MMGKDYTRDFRGEANDSTGAWHLTGDRLVAETQKGALTQICGRDELMALAKAILDKFEVCLSEQDE